MHYARQCSFLFYHMHVVLEKHLWKKLERACSNEPTWSHYYTLIEMRLSTARQGYQVLQGYSNPWDQHEAHEDSKLDTPDPILAPHGLGHSSQWHLTITLHNMVVHTPHNSGHIQIFLKHCYEITWFTMYTWTSYITIHTLEIKQNIQWFHNTHKSSFKL